jgi:hypothetical protein
MSMLKMAIVGPSICLALAGCSAANRTPIVAGAVDTVGVAISAGVQDQGGNLTVGYKGAKFAVVPVTNEDGEILALRDGPDKRRGFSVFAMLGVDAKGGAALDADIQQVVAVGPAAEIWALGRSGVTQAEIDRARAAGLIR